MDDAEALRTPSGLGVPAEALEWSFVRSSGPGGQNVNKRSTRVTLAVDLRLLTGPDAAVARARAALGDTLRVTSQVTRSQWRNRRDCLERAAQLIDAATVTRRRRRPTRPTQGSVERRLSSKRRLAEKKLSRRGDW